MACVNATERKICVLGLVLLATSVGACSDDSSTTVVARDAAVEAALGEASADAYSSVDVVVVDVASEAATDVSSDDATDAGQADLDAPTDATDAAVVADVSTDDSTVVDAADSGPDGGGGGLQMCDQLNSVSGVSGDAGNQDALTSWGLEMANDYLDALGADCRVAGLVPSGSDDLALLNNQVAGFSVMFFGCPGSDQTPPTLDQLVPGTAATNALTRGDVLGVAQAYVSAIPTMLDMIGADPLTAEQSNLVVARMAGVVAAWPTSTATPDVYSHSVCAVPDAGADGAVDASEDTSADAAVDSSPNADATVDGSASADATTESGTD